MANNSDKFFKGISIQSLVTIGFGILEIVVFSIMSRLLSKADFGYFAAITGIMAILLSVSEAGLGSAVIQKKDASQRFVSTAFTLSCIVGFVVSSLLFVFAPYLAELIVDSTLTTPLRVMSVNIFLYGIISIGNGILYRELNFRTIGLINIVSYLIASIVGVIMAYNHCGVYSVVVLSVIHSLLNAIFLFVKIKFPKPGFNREDAKNIVFYGGWLTAGVILNNISNQVDRLFLSKWLSVQALGSYNRPSGFVSSISTKINSIFDSVLFPILSDFQNDKTVISGVFIKSISLINVFSILLAAVFFFNADLIISVFFGSNWDELIPVLQIISISVIFNINGRLVDCFFRSLAYVRLSFVLRLISVIITFTAIYVGAKYGILGVAFAVVIANITNIYIKLFSLAFKINVSPVVVLWRMITAWRVVVPILMVGIPFLMLNNTSWFVNISFAVLFVVIVLLELLCFPRFIGDVYTMQVFPKLKRGVDNIVKR